MAEGYEEEGLASVLCFSRLVTGSRYLLLAVFNMGISCSGARAVGPPRTGSKRHWLLRRARAGAPAATA